MTTQTVRKAALVLSFGLFQVPLFHMFLSPVLPIAAASRGVVPASLVVYAALFVLSLFLGRAFCGWFCPGAAMQECCSIWIKKPARGGRGYLLKYFISSAWLLAVLATAARAGGFRAVDLLYGTQSANPARAFFLRFGALLIVPPLSIAFGRWASCHYICWIAPFLVAGSKLRRLLRLPSLRLAVERGGCTECGECRQKCPMSLDVQAMVSKGSMENSECVLCGTCVAACPAGTIRFSFR